MVDDDDDDIFGDFNFAMNHPNQINNRASSTSIDDDDDWGDFVDHSSPICVGFDRSGGFPRAQSSPIQWAKPQGALPLSIFGEEEELGSGVVGGSSEDSFVEKESGSAKKGGNLGVGVGFDDLIANLYSPNHQIKAGSPLESNMEFDPLNFSNSLNSKSSDSNLNGNGVHYYGSQTNFESDSVNFEANGVKSNGFHSDLTNVGESNEDDREEVDDFDGWEFKAAESVTPTGGDQKSEVDTKSREGLGGVAQAFEFAINGHNHGDSIFQSNGAVNNIDELAFGFNLDASHVAQHGVLSNSQNKNGQNGLDNGLNPSPIDRNANGDGHIWDFKDAFSDASDYKLEESKPVIVPPNGVEALVLNGSVSLFAPDGISHKSSEQQNFDLNFNLNWGKEDRKLFNGNHDGNFHDTREDVNTTIVNENDDFNENVWGFKSAYSDSGSNNKGEPVESVAGLEAPAFGSSSSSQKNWNLLSSHRKALPLSIFGDEGLEVETTDEDASTFISVTREEHDSKTPGSSVSINDLISSLYSQAEKNGSVNYSPEENENGINSSSRMSHSDLGNDDDDDSWEFKDASPDVNVPDQTYVTILGDLPKQPSTKLQFDCYMDFYHKLNFALNHAVNGVLENLKKAQSNASLSGEEAKLKAMYEEIQNFTAELAQENLTADNFSSDVLLPRNNSFSELFEMLRDPKFQILEEEFQLSERLLLAENDLRSAVELLKHVVSTLKILKLVSVEEQSNYVSIWNQMLFICFQELKHGALIWKESLQRNVESCILSEPQGKRYICALGEIYRVVQVLRASVKLYKPWILLGQVDPSGLISLLNECSDIWSSSGLVEALCRTDGPIDCKALLDSINFIQNLDEWSLRKHVLLGQQPTCYLSLLNAESISGLDLVVWNGENYFLKLANLWANRIGRDPPFIQHTNNR